jgi:hypothetical protein
MRRHDSAGSSQGMSRGSSPGGIRRFASMLALGVGIQALALGVTVLVVPRGEGWFAGLSTVLAYLVVGQWLGYGVLFVIVRNLGRSAGEALRVCAATLAVAVLVYVGWNQMRLIQNRAAMARYEQDQEFKGVPAESITRMAQETRERIRRSVVCSPPTFALSCPSSFRIPEGSGRDFPRKHEILTITVPIEFKEAGKYRLALGFASRLDEPGARAARDARLELDREIASPGRHRVEWAIGAGRVWGYFVEHGAATVTVTITRLASLRELYPERVNPRSPHIDDDIPHPIPEAVFHLPGVAVTSTTEFPGSLDCPTFPEPRLVRS